VHHIPYLTDSTQISCNVLQSLFCQHYEVTSSLSVKKQTHIWSRLMIRSALPSRCHFTSCAVNVATKQTNGLKKTPYCRRGVAAAHGQYSQNFRMDNPSPQSKLSFPMRDLHPIYYMVRWATRVHIWKDISIASVVSAGLAIVTDRLTGRPRYPVCNNRLHLQYHCDAA